MVKLNKINIISILILTLSLVHIASASSYSIDFTQVADKIVIKEIINNRSLEAYVDLGLLDRSSNILYFVKRINFNQDYTQVQVKLNLDKGVIINKEMIFPTGYDIETDGQTISIVWNLKNVILGQDFAIFVTMEDTKNNYNILYWILSLIVIIFIAFFIYKKLEKKEKIKILNVKSNEKKKENEDYNYLLDTEKKVIEELKKADRNEMWQKQIQNITGYSKAKVSRLVRNLESRNLVKKIPFGNTNKIRLK